MKGWTLDDLPSLEGQVWLVTGANSGLGLESVRALAARGARVVMACRALARGEEAAADVRRTTPGAQLQPEALDLGSLEAIERCATRVLAREPRLDGLLNNAGVMAIPRSLTADGFERQLGTNHLGHFALTLRLLPALSRAPAARVVTVSSLAHRGAILPLDDLMGERRYTPWGAYAQSKLANLLFTFELQRRLRAAGSPVRAVAAHPGYAATRLFDAQMERSPLAAWVMGAGSELLAQPASDGALPQLYAAAHAEVEGGAYYGPGGWFELRGSPRRVDSSARSKDVGTAQRLWEASEALTGLRFPG